MTRPISPLSCPEFLPTLDIFAEEDWLWQKMRDRKEMETILKSKELCIQYGLDQEKAIVNYLRRYGSFMTEEKK
jgi:hypothetical protein